MANEATTIEEQQLAGLNKARNLHNTAKDLKSAAAGSPVAKAKLALSLGEKLPQHRSILMAAVFFDILAMIPGVSVFFNFIFGLILLLYFGPKKKKGGFEFTKIALPIAGGSIVDFFVGILPVNVGVTLFRIALS